MHVTVVGYGTTGKLDAGILRRAGFKVSVVDPQPAEHPVDVQVWHAIDEIPCRTRSDVDMWVVSNPTADHLSTLRSVFRWQPNARIMLEKPAFSSQEIDEIRGLLAEHPQARLMVNQLYRHSRVVSLLRAAMPHAGGRCPDSIEIAFTRDHRLDNPTGRFSDVSDTDYHVLGYEWIHMLSVLEGLLPRAAWQQYLTGPMEYSRFTATRDSGGSVTGLREHSWIGPTRVSMYSTITKDLSGQGAPPGCPATGNA